MSYREDKEMLGRNRKVRQMKLERMTKVVACSGAEDRGGKA